MKVISSTCNYCGKEWSDAENIHRHSRTLNPDGTENKAECELRIKVRKTTQH